MRRTFNFGKADAFLDSSSSESEEQSASIVSEAFSETTEQKAPVTQLLEKIDRPNNGYKKAFNFKMVPRKKIVFHKENDFPMETIEQRAADILEAGLIHNLEALYDEEQDLYIIESGEKRTRAIDLLIERFRNYDGETDNPDYINYLKHVKQFEVEGYPVNVKYYDPMEYGLEEGSEEAEELRSIESKIRVNRANLDVQALEPAFIRKKIEENSALYVRRNSLLKKENRVNVNKAIAEEMNISERQVTKYKAISRLIPELQQLFDERGITVNEGAKYAMLDETEQRQILELIESGADKKEVGVLQEKLSQMQREIDANRKEVEELEKSKENAYKALEDEQAAAKQLEEKIRAEVSKESQEQGLADKLLIDELQKQLAQANENIEKQQSRSKKLEQEQKDKLADLELKLEAKEKQALVMPTKITRQALKLDSILESLQTLVTQFEKEVKAYEAIYDEGTGEVKPNEYKAKLRERLLIVKDA